MVTTKSTQTIMKRIECTEILQELKITPSPPHGGVTLLIDSDGNQLFKVPIDIDAMTLLSIVDYGGRQIMRGREQVKSELLALIGAQPAERRRAA